MVYVREIIIITYILSTYNNQYYKMILFYLYVEWFDFNKTMFSLLAWLYSNTLYVNVFPLNYLYLKFIDLLGTRWYSFRILY